MSPNVSGASQAKLPRKLPNIIRGFISLPVEIVHQILTDLPITKIFKLASYNVQYMDDCILTHLDLQRMFPSRDHLTTAKTHFKLYTDIQLRRRSRAEGECMAAEYLLQTAAMSDLALYHSLIYWFRNYILEALADAEHRVPFLSAYSPTPLPHVWDNATIAGLEARWIALNTAQQVLNDRRASQLRRLAELMTTYPGMLRMLSDRTRECRQTTAHIVQHLRGSADRIENSQVLSTKAVARALFRFDFLPIVPYDKYLRLFLKVIKRYPASRILCPGSSEQRTSTIAEGGGRRQRPSSLEKYAYPDPIVDKIFRVVDGLAYVHSPHAKAPLYKRTEYTPYSEGSWDGRGVYQPRFWIPETDLGLRQSLEAKPLQEEEIEWLTAFLEVCTFMSSMDDARWSGEETVGEMWRRKMI